LAQGRPLGVMSLAGSQSYKELKELPSSGEVESFARKLACTVPLLFASLVPFFWYPLSGAGAESFPWSVVAFGALGWWIALLLRLPVIVVAKACLERHGCAEQDVMARVRSIGIFISGPAEVSACPKEEGVRTVLLFFFGWAKSFPAVFALGLGWTSIELLFTVLQSLAVLRLLRDALQGDERAVEGFRMLATQIGREDPLALHPAWGFVERCGAHSMHLALGLLVSLSPWMVFATLVIHSLCNWSVATFLPQAPAAVELLFLLFSIGLLLAGLFLWDVV